MATAAPSTIPDPTPAAPRPRRRRGRRIARALLLLVGLLVVVLLGAGLWLRHRVAASLPQVSGELALPGLSAPVAVERDALGIPTLRAATRLDAARALGFVHAQDRFFQMDFLRRVGSGDLAEVLGPALLTPDKNHRLHRFRQQAARTLAAMPPAQRALLEAYADGVNAGLRALGDKPFEHIMLRFEPRPWQPADSLLAVYGMYFVLSDSRARVETDLGRIHGRVPAQLYDFLVPFGTEWDAPLVGPAFATPPVPGPAIVDLRTHPLPKAAALGPPPRQAALPGWLEGAENGDELYGRSGSNVWAVSGAHTADGHALVANDMHLGIGVPNTWYRASWTWREADGAERRVTGITLPGMPVLAVGSTGRIAWGFSNSFVDASDLIDLELDARDPDIYRTPAGPRHFEHTSERIRVRGQADEIFDVATTIWGPVLVRDEQGRPQRAMAWTADFPGGANMEIFNLETANDVDEAIEIAHASGLPPQNFVVADASGRIGWTIIGLVPRRIGWNGQVPSSWADGSHRWDGLLPSAEVPKVVDPPAGRIWAANNRIGDGEILARLGDGCFDLGSRARQIRDRLLSLEKATPRDMLALQLDDRALFLARWRGLLLETLTPEAVKAEPRRAEMRRLLASTWTGHASIDSVAYRLVRDFRDTLEKQVFDNLSGLEVGEEPPYYRPHRRFEGPLWRLVTERPPHLLARRFKTWDEQLLAAADDVLNRLQALGPLAERTWGERNTMQVRHPLSLTVPPLARWLDVPARPLAGDLDMPRVAGIVFSASERMVVSPGHEEAGIFHMPVGESGHPLSPHFRDGHAAWLEGRPTPFLPGPPADVLELVPKKSS